MQSFTYGKIAVGSFIWQVDSAKE